MVETVTVSNSNAPSGSVGNRLYCAKITNNLLVDLTVTELSSVVDGSFTSSDLSLIGVYFSLVSPTDLDNLFGGTAPSTPPIGINITGSAVIPPGEVGYFIIAVNISNSAYIDAGSTISANANILFTFLDSPAYLDTQTGEGGTVTLLPFTPNALPNLWAWWNAGNVTLSGSDITGADDLSGNGRQLMSAPGIYPQYLVSDINGLPSMQFLGPDIFSTGSVNFPDITSSGCTIYIVGSQDTDGINTDNLGQFISVGGNPNSGVNVGRISESNIIYGKYQTYLESDCPQKAATNGTYYSIRMRVRTTLPDNFLSLDNGTESFMPPTESDPYVANLILIGNSGENVSNKKIAEIIIYTNSQSYDNINLVENYLNAKYNLY